ncbi:MAG: STAS domain-containing protein [Synergistaceae bacterium]|jgi:anti-sigma B factor antagonist|nr:STAS domain-containing protein [Synergistaceae bacterium]
MEINVSKESGAVMLEMSGNLDSIGSGELQAAIKEILAKEPEADLALDFASVAFISSAGLRVLLLAMKKLSSAGHSMKLLNVSEPVKKIFSMTGFSAVFDIV